MRAMILAAGRGERMRPLTDALPKPLLPVGGKPLIVWHLERLAAAGIHDIVINHAWLGEKIEAALGDGAQWHVRLRYSPEAGALETAGGIKNALPLLGDEPFLVINGDIWCDWSPSQAEAIAADLTARKDQAWLLLVDNPEHHPDGDFVLRRDDSVLPRGNDPALTFSGIGIYAPSLFDGVEPGHAARLAPVLLAAMDDNRVHGARHTGTWVDVGTPERLAALDASLQSRESPITGTRS
jgi:MurNAc alpha-1-phosphate uridylyltransferase